jgi:hypothetical protein
MENSLLKGVEIGRLKEIFSESPIKYPIMILFRLESSPTEGRVNLSEKVLRVLGAFNYFTNPSNKVVNVGNGTIGVLCGNEEFKEITWVLEKILKGLGITAPGYALTLEDIQHGLNLTALGYTHSLEGLLAGLSLENPKEPINK